jgi:hypothetical protein
MLSTILSSLFGGALRLAPEVIRFFDKKEDRAHELAMVDRQIALENQKLEADKQRSYMRVNEAQVTGDIQLDAAGLDALQKAIQAQGQASGVKWVDGFNSLMRPLITFWWVIVLTTLVEICMFTLLVKAGTAPVEAVLKLWGEEEKAIVAGIINFWFLDRVIRRRNK